jgi:hypothetical protein
MYVPRAVLMDLEPGTMDSVRAAPMVRFSAPTTSFSCRLELVTTGPKATTPREPSLSTRYSMLMSFSKYLVLSCAVLV